MTLVSDQTGVTHSISVLDLFAGAGGLSQGFKEASTRFRTVAAVDSDVAAAATFAANHEGEVYAGDIGTWLNSYETPQADIVVGGPPCQGFSTLGLQAPDDARSLLWREYAKTVTRAQPKYFVLENVGPFEKSHHYGQLWASTTSRGMLRDYTFQMDIMNAADYGAAQARRRCIVIGHHRDLPFPGWPTPTKSRQNWVNLGSALDAVAYEVDGIQLPDRRTVFNGKEFPGTFRSQELHLGRDYSNLSLKRFAAIPAGGNRFDLPDDLLAPCWRKHKTGSADVMGRLSWDKPSVTIRTEFFKPEKGRYIHPSAHRAITHFEAALIQGFPRDYNWVGSKVAIARQIGNAVPVPLARAIGAYLAAFL